MAALRVEGLPVGALEAAAVFHAEWLPKAREMLSEGHLVLIFPRADHTHRAWRLAAVQGLTHEYAPLRVNAVASDSAAAIAAALRYLASAPGVTGQYLPLDDLGAGPVV